MGAMQGAFGWRVAADRSARSLCKFVDGAVAPGPLIVTDDGAVMPVCESEATITTPSPNVGIPK